MDGDVEASSKMGNCVLLLSILGLLLLYSMSL